MFDWDVDLDEDGDESKREMISYDRWEDQDSVGSSSFDEMHDECHWSWIGTKAMRTKVSLLVDTGYPLNNREREINHTVPSVENGNLYSDRS